jgi:hypothetical protein
MPVKSQGNASDMPVELCCWHFLQVIDTPEDHVLVSKKNRRRTWFASERHQSPHLRNSKGGIFMPPLKLCGCGGTGIHSGL